MSQFTRQHTLLVTGVRALCIYQCCKARDKQAKLFPLLRETIVLRSRPLRSAAMSFSRTPMKLFVQ
jgi:hypothetical protein